MFLVIKPDTNNLLLRALEKNARIKKVRKILILSFVILTPAGKQSIKKT